MCRYVDMSAVPKRPEESDAREGLSPVVRGLSPVVRVLGLELGSLGKEHLL